VPLIPFSAAASRLDSLARGASCRRASVESRCTTCASREHCLPQGLTAETVHALDEQLGNTHCRLERGEHLYHAGDAFRAVFAVRAGWFKRSAFLGNGLERVTGFYTAGSLLGLEGISEDRYASSAVALETSDICVIPYSRLCELSRSSPGLQRSFHRRLGTQFLQDQARIMALSAFCPESSEIRLPMKRIDIANFLGIEEETISRHLTKLQMQRLISVHRSRSIRVLDRQGLMRKCPARVAVPNHKAV
jgi:CRP/FNR family transcriptional regulator